MENRSSSPATVALLFTSVIGACASTAGAPDAGAPAATTMATAQIGPLPVAAGEEKSVCIVQRLASTTDVLATRFIADLTPGTHHLIVYRTNATAESLTPSPCTSFEGAVDGSSVPLFLANQPHFELTLPRGVGVALPAGQMVRIEAHYINAGAAPVQAGGTLTVQGVTAASAPAFQKADFGFWGTKQIALPPQSSGSTGVKFQAGAPGTSVFAVTSYQHKLGTRVQAWIGRPGDTQTRILDDKYWWNPALVAVDPPFSLDGTKGVSYQCDWLNTTYAPVGFGEDTASEVCLVGVYYFPGRGTDNCFDGVCAARN